MCVYMQTYAEQYLEVANTTVHVRLVRPFVRFAPDAKLAELVRVVVVVVMVVVVVLLLLWLLWLWLCVAVVCAMEYLT